MIPDIERVVSDYLRANLNVSTRVVAKVPPDTATGWIQVRLIDAPQLANSRADHLVPFALQFDCYAGFSEGKPQANDLVRAVRETLVQMQGVIGGTVITGVRVTSMLPLTDPGLKDDKDNPRERYVLDATVYAHA